MIALLNSVRIATITIACICMVLMSLQANRRRVAKGDRFTVFATAALVVAMLLIVVGQVQQIGHELRTWYGLPMLSAISLLTLAALWRSDV